MLRTPTLFDLFWLIALAAIYGSAFSAIKIAVPEVGVYGLVLARVVIATLVLMPYAVWRGWQWPTSAQTWKLLSLLCVFNLLLPFALVSWAQLNINASLMALLMGAGPLFGLVFSHIATKDDRITPAKLIGVALGFVGVAVVVGVQAYESTSQALLAQAAALLASVCYAASGLVVRRIEGIQPTRLATIILAMGSVALLAGAPFALDEPLETLSSLDLSVVLTVLYLGIVTTGVAYIVRYRMIRAVGMSYFALSINLVPVFGIAIAALILSEPLSLSLIVGLGCILGGLLIARFGSKGSKTDAEANSIS